MTKFTRAIASQLAGLTLLGLAIVGIARVLPVVAWITDLQQRLAAMQVWGCLLYTSPSPRD